MQMAINLHIQLTLNSQGYDGGPKPLAVLYSNRSAAFASSERWDEAADDAEQCIALMPNWSKVIPLSLEIYRLHRHYSLPFTHMSRALLAMTSYHGEL